MVDKHNLSVINKGFLLFGRPIKLVLLLLCGFGLYSAYGATITYTEDMTDFPNPERGFWESNNYTTNTTVFKKYIYIPTYGPLSQSYLDGVEKTFTDVRIAKKKIVPRFIYNHVDAPLDSMLKQIEQLRPIFQRNYDVIAVMEAGFIGEFGEWHSSPHFKEKDSIGRRMVLFKLLDVLPRERMVLLRYNWQKRAIFGSNEPITISQAFDGSNKSRTGAFNDCFVANNIDAGTYHVPPWEYNALGIEQEKDYLSADNLYVPQDGETCQVGSTSYSTCERALADMRRMRWDMIRTGWYSSVLNLWKNQGCWDEISKRLGYRIVLVQGTYDDDVTDGYLDATLHLKNVGFGKIYNPRKLEMVFRSNSTGVEYTLPIPADPRFWSPGMDQTLTIRLPIITSVPLGTYSLFLNLPDPAPRLDSIPAYSIRLANTNVWQAAKGYNSLMHTVRISSHSTVSINSNLPLEKKFGTNVHRVTPEKNSFAIYYYNYRSTRVTIDVFNLSGSLVNRLVDQNLSAGEHNFTWNRFDRSGRLQPAGVYFVTFRSEGLMDTRQVILKK